MLLFAAAASEPVCACAGRLLFSTCMHVPAGSDKSVMCVHVPAGGDKEGAALLSSVELVAARSGASLEVGTEIALKLIPCPTPRWPDLLVAYSPGDRLLFTSKLFSAHVRYAVSPSLVSCVLYYYRFFRSKLGQSAGLSVSRTDSEVRLACPRLGSLNYAFCAGQRRS